MAVVTPAGIVAGVAAVLNTIPSIGRVHSQRRMLRTEAQIQQVLYSSSLGRLQGWMISPAPTNTTVSEKNPGHYPIGQKGGGNVLTTFQFQIEGWMGIDDGADSETTFRDLAWSVADEFNAYGLINVAGLVQQFQADIEVFTYAMLANLMFVHYTRIGVAFRGRTRPNP